MDAWWWTVIVFPVVFTLFGAAASLYGTVVFERYGQFAQTIRAVAQARQLAIVRPTDVDDLEHSRAEIYDFGRFLERKRYELLYQRQGEASTAVARLLAFTERADAVIGRMLADLKHAPTKRNNVAATLLSFQIEYDKIYDREFKGFERNIKPSNRALLTFRRQAVVMTPPTLTPVNYFNDLLLPSR